MPQCSASSPIQDHHDQYVQLLCTYAQYMPVELLQPTLVSLTTPAIHQYGLISDGSTLATTSGATAAFPVLLPSLQHHPALCCYLQPVELSLVACQQLRSIAGFELYQSACRSTELASALSFCPCLRWHVSSSSNSSSGRVKGRSSSHVSTT
jgi:hypothetical protein